MGDRCWMQVTCRKKDQARFEKLGFSLDDQMSDDIVVLVDDQANYGHDDAFQPRSSVLEVARGGPLKVPFLAIHGSGGTYGPGAYACDGKKAVFVETDQDSFPIVRLNEDDTLDQQMLENAKAYNALYRKVRKMFKLDQGDSK